jgi:hypothetical protein
MGSGHQGEIAVIWALMLGLGLASFAVLWGVLVVVEHFGGGVK